VECNGESFKNGSLLVLEIFQRRTFRPGSIYGSSTN